MQRNHIYYILRLSLNSSVLYITLQWVKFMQLRELNGQLIAHTSTIDVIKGEYLEHLQEFLVSEEVSKDLQKYPNYLNPDYWYLAVAKDLSIGDDKLYWEVTVRDLITQATPLHGIVKFEDDSPVLAFSWE